MNYDCTHTEEEDADICTVDRIMWYCVQCLWEKTRNLPVISLSIQDQLEPLNEIIWDDTDRTITEIWHSNRPNPHKKRIRDADLNYPILVKQMGKDRYHILDGCHRLAKASLLLKKTHIDCKIVPENVLDECVWIE